MDHITQGTVIYGLRSDAFNILFVWALDDEF